MSELDDKLGAILENPQLMQQIMNMAQSLGQGDPSPPQKQEIPVESRNILPDFDPVMVSKVMSLAGKSNIDRNQKTLLNALQPYLSSQRLQKLEKAMRAAKLADVASGLMQSGAIPFLSGR